MKQRTTLCDVDVQAIASAAWHFAIDHHWPVTVAIVDDGGHLMHLHRQENASPMSVEMAIAKARTAALTRRPTHFYEKLILEQGRLSFLATPMSGMVEGGLPIRMGDSVVGAIGVSGVTSGEDSAIAMAGLEALNESLLMDKI